MKSLLLLLIPLVLFFAFPSVAATPGFDTLVNYDTAWTFVYDGGKVKSGNPSLDAFYDVKHLTNNISVCVGVSGDTSSSQGQVFVTAIDGSGKMLWKKLIKGDNYSQAAHAITIAKNNDLIIGGDRYTSPFVMRTDNLGNIKWFTWYYDTLNVKSKLTGKGVVNSIIETSRGTIACAAGDPYPFNDGNLLTDYAAFLEFDSQGTLLRSREWREVDGYNIAGFAIQETEGHNYLLAGNQAVFYLDSFARPQWQTDYTFYLDLVGSKVNNVRRVKLRRDNTPIVMGQAYEGNCWTRYKKLYYDAWWSPIGYESGLNTNWDTAGIQGADDNLYDLTQLNNGNLVFVGQNGKYDVGGVWAVVTDSTGKKLLWQNQVKIMYKTSDGRGPKPYSVCATPDGGFTVAGDYPNNAANGGTNAFAAHFVPKPVLAVLTRKPSSLLSTQSFSTHISNTMLVVTNANSKDLLSVSLFTATGKQIASQAGHKAIRIELKGFAKGMYFAKVNAGMQNAIVRIAY